MENIFYYEELYFFLALEKAYDNTYHDAVCTQYTRSDEATYLEPCP